MRSELEKVEGKTSKATKRAQENRLRQLLGGSDKARFADPAFTFNKG